MTTKPVLAAVFRAVFVVVVALCSLAPIFVHAQSTSVSHFLTADMFAVNGTSDDQLGSAVATFGTSTGSLVVAGAFGSGNDQGTAYLFTCDTTAATCTQGQQLMAKDGAAGDFFGAAVAISGTLVVVGAYNKAAGQGAAYTFACTSATECSQGPELLASDGAPGDNYGAAVALSGSLVVIGAYQKTVGNNTDQGKVYMFSCSSDATSCSTGQSLVASDGAANDYFGSAVAISGTLVAVGAWGRASQQGAVYLFTCSITASSCTQGKVLVDQGGAMGDNFGVSLAMNSVSGGADGQLVIVGAASKTIGSNSSQGAVFVFSCSSSTSCTSESGLEVTSSDGKANDHFGASVALYGAIMVISASDAVGNGDGAIYMFSCTDSGSSCTQGSKVVANDGPSGTFRFGVAVALFGWSPATVVVGASWKTVNNHNYQGKAYMFVSDPSGACDCTTGWAGLECDTCAYGHADPSTGCTLLSTATLPPTVHTTYPSTPASTAPSSPPSTETSAPSAVATASPTTPTTTSPPIPSASATAPPATSTPTHNAAGLVTTSIFAIVISALAVTLVISVMAATQ